MQEKKDEKKGVMMPLISKKNLHYLREQAKIYGFKVVGREVDGVFGIYLSKNNQLYSKVF